MEDIKENRERVFFSYSRADTKFALRLARALRDSQVPIWLDQLDIQPGANWDREVEGALRITKATLVILSPDSVSSENVMDEIGFAIEEGKRIVPVMYRECSIPLRLRRRQWVDFRGDFDSAIVQLQELLQSDGRVTRSITKAEEDMDTSAPRITASPIYSPSQPPPAQPRSLRGWYVGAGGAALVVAGLLAAVGADVDGDDLADETEQTVASALPADDRAAAIHRFEELVRKNSTPEQLEAYLHDCNTDDDPTLKAWAANQLELLEQRRKLDELKKKLDSLDEKSEQRNEVAAEIRQTATHTKAVMAKQKDQPAEVRSDTGLVVSQRDIDTVLSALKARKAGDAELVKAVGATTPEGNPPPAAAKPPPPAPAGSETPKPRAPAPDKPAP